MLESHLDYDLCFHITDLCSALVPKQLLLPSGTISAGSALVLSMRVWLAEDESQTAEGRVVVRVSPQPLSAVIVGGSSISSSASAGLTLSAAESLDPDSGNSMEGLSFLWTCIPPGGRALGPCLNYLGQPLDLPHRSTVQLPPYTLQPASTPYTFVVTVKKQWHSPSAAMQMVLVNKDKSENPHVVLTGATCLRAEADQRMCCRAANGLGGESVMMANPDSRFIFSAAAVGTVVGANGIVTFYWELLSKDGSQQIILNASEAPLGQTGAFFVLQASAALLEPGGSYSVRVRTNSAGWAEQDLEVSRPPAGGDFTACLILSTNADSDANLCVTTGQALLDTFQLICASWADPEDAGALEYRFGYCLAAIQSSSTDGGNNSCGSDGAGIVWLKWGYEASVNMAFPQGFVTALAQVSLIYLVASSLHRIPRI